jgi:4-amino-4-deoxy-L-arabinose transferase-like glycosyltransferase
MIPARIVASWNTVSTRWNPIALIVGAWAVLTMPLIFFRGYNADEGLAVINARTAVEDGYWLNTHTFNVRFVERPTLLSWIIAVISEPFGHVSQVAARLPVALFLLLGCLLIYALLRKVAASVPAALFGIALFLACPLVMRSYVMITADMPLAVLLFLAFVLWWDGYASGTLGFGRWIAIGLVLALAGLMKGPQPVSYFALGIGLFVLGSRSWRQIPGLIVAGIVCVIALAAWCGAVYAQGDEVAMGDVHAAAAGRIAPIVASFNLVTETLPAMCWLPHSPSGRDFAARALDIPASCRRSLVMRSSPRRSSCSGREFDTALFLPDGTTARVLGALGYDSLGKQRPEIVAPLLLLTAGLLAYALAYSVASPFFPTRFRHTQVEAARLSELVQAQPAPIYTIGATALNVLPYFPGRILFVSPGELMSVSAPAWMVLPVADADVLLSQRRGGLREMTPSGVNEWRLLRLDK